ncbi:MAG: amino acid transporter, partial [Proteobacteria bacterium]|nr:amino acid transporter [Pseudomonadota bacterium]
ICYLIKSHYKKVGKAISKLNDTIHETPLSDEHYNNNKPDTTNLTAIQLVSGFNSLGIHTMLSVLSNFPWLYKNFIFIGVSVVDSNSFRDKEELEKHRVKTITDLNKYVEYAKKLGIAAEYIYHVSTYVIEAATDICIQTAKEFPNSTVFAGKLMFQQERFYHKLLHNDTSFNIQKNLQHYGITTVIMPVTIELD